MTVRSIKQIEQWNKNTAKGRRRWKAKATGRRHPLTKEQARALCEQAAASHPITRLPDGWAAGLLTGR
jgi:hypothetical protein